MSVDLFYEFPFERWERDVVIGAVTKVGRSLGSSYVLRVDEPDPLTREGGSEGTFVVAMTFRTRGPASSEHHGALFLESGDHESPAYVHIEGGGHDDLALDAAGDVAHALCELLGGAPVDDDDDDDDDSENGETSPNGDGENVAFETFDDLSEHLGETYEATKNDDGSRTLTLGWDDSPRTQRVDVTQVTVFEETWVRVESPVARVDATSADQILSFTSPAVGALARVGSEMLLRTTLPLDALTPARLEAVVEALAEEADAIEEGAVGGDDL